MENDLIEKFYILDSINNLKILTNSFKIEEDNLILNIENLDIFKQDKLEVFFKNIKSKKLISSSYIINNSDLIIDLTNIKTLSSDYEYSFYLVDPRNSCVNIIYPKPTEYLSNTLSLIDNNLYKYKWFVRVLGNGELRISTICIFNNYYDLTL